MGLFAGFVVVCSRCVEWLVVAVVGSIHIFESVSIVGLMVLPIFTALWVHFHAWCVMVLLFLFFVCSRCVEWFVVVAGIVHIFTSVSIVGLMILLFFTVSWVHFHAWCVVLLLIRVCIFRCLWWSLFIGFSKFDSVGGSFSVPIVSCCLWWLGFAFFPWTCIYIFMRKWESDCSLFLPASNSRHRKQNHFVK